ncbi:MAG: hypothetical protein H6819_01700 [Phycisphaerales bacterium]|nr:hypothetical protein [Phycisphaerales bacterium]MCB9857076.1 hypothetical protein [Phycisphaerales bacterium]MCB9861797.1 hypothetical protein [Phycisphaerales bacterium]
MKYKLTIACILILAATTAVHADVWPTLNPGGMKHIMIGFENNAVSLHLDSADAGPLLMENFGNTHIPPADVLDGKGYNDQYGWLADGLIAPPAGGAFWIRSVVATPRLEIYEGGMRMMRDTHTYAPIFGTSGSPDAWKWNGTMTHHWNAAVLPGFYEATFEVYIGDAVTGVALPEYAADQVTLSWNYVPEPASALMCVMGLAIVVRRKRIARA